MFPRILIISLSICSFGLAQNALQEEETPEYWLNLGKEELRVALNLQRQSKGVAKNVIVFIGDGMSIPTITAARILKGQLQGNSGEETVLAMDRFHHVGLAKTYSVDRQVPDSASTITAILCGVKANDFTIGVSAAARRLNCSSQEGTEVDSVLIDAFKAGKSTGFVTTTRINHATPAGTYAHTTSREWYGDGDLSDEAKANGCKDIAQQFYDNSDKITVALGGGRRYFQPNSTNDPEYPEVANSREDGQDLIAMWLENQSLRGLTASYVWNQSAFDSVDPATTDRLLGLFEPGDMQFDPDRFRDPAGEPSIAEMTEKAIRILEKNETGFFLMVEGGRIDHAHHGTNAFRALHDTLAFDGAIAKAVELTSDNDTLIIVTADHSHTFNFGGYTDRGNNIFGKAVSGRETFLALDQKPFTSLLYGNGPGFQGFGVNPLEPHVRQDLTEVQTENHLYFQQTAVPLGLETHGGDDVSIMARGPMSHLIHGVHEQSYIATVIRYAINGTNSETNNENNCGRRRRPSRRPSRRSRRRRSRRRSRRQRRRPRDIKAESFILSSARVGSTDVPTAAAFLGMSLNSTQAALALYLLFGVAIVFFVFSVTMSFVVLSVKKSKARLVKLEGCDNEMAYEKSAL